jgi:hypothetical protein
VALVGSLLPLLLGIMMSPLAIMALVAVLLSARGRENGTAFLLGWAVGVVGVLALSFVLLDALQVHERRTPPLWVPVVRTLLAAGLIVGAVLVVRHGRERVRAMAAAPQLPGWLQRVDTFTPGRTFALGIGIFALNPVDASCAFLAAMDIRLADLSTPVSALATGVFAVLAVVPIAVPVLVAAAQGERAAPFLARLRTWIAGHTSLLNAALLLVIAALQLQKAVSGFLAA